MPLYNFIIPLIVLANFNKQITAENYIKQFLRNQIFNLKNFVFKKQSEIKERLIYALDNNLADNLMTNSTVTENKTLDHEDIKPTKNTFILTTPQLAATHGRIMETHVTNTLDGYVLTLHRLRPDTLARNDAQQTVLLHHGLFGSSADWIQLGREKSLPYILSKAGHDVWIANSRGNFYSRNHLSMSITTDAFWNFSWQEIGEFDLPAIVDYIRKEKGSSAPIDFIGHSLGATAFLALVSGDHNCTGYFRMAFLLAPLAIMRNTQGPLRALAMENQATIQALLGTGEFEPFNKDFMHLMSNICGKEDYFCRNPLFFFTGAPKQSGTRDIQSQLLDYAGSGGGSSKTIRHYLQLVKNKNFHHFGKPQFVFSVENINVPLIMLSSNDDKVSNATDNQLLYRHLLNPAVHLVITKKNFSHTEFVWGSLADKLIFFKIRSLINIGPEAITQREFVSPFAR